MYQIAYTLLAKQELRRIAFDISEVSKDVKTGVKFVKEIQSKISKLETFPNIGSLPNDRVLISKGYRLIVYKKYLIFYTVDEALKTVYIKSIINSRRDYEKILRRI